MSKRWKILYLIIWLFISWQMGFFQHMKKGPFGIHQGAQADRASIALNYYEENMNLFMPRVHETRGFQGIVGCELPIVNYLAAISYKLLGFNDSHYRIIMWVIMAFGLYAVFATFVLFGFNKIIALLLSFGWYCSPILLFYTPNFLPDTASLAFNLMALHQLFLYIKKGHSSKRTILFSIFIGLAALIKVTSLILPIAIVLIFILFYVTKNKLPVKITNLGLWILGLTISLGITFIWYKYSAYLNVRYGSSLFFLESKWANSYVEFKSHYQSFEKNWLGHIYKTWILKIIAGFYFFLLIGYFKRNRFLALLSLLYILGTIAFFILMSQQFQNHDYYTITLYPSILLAIIYSAVTIKGLKGSYLLKNISVILVFIFFFHNHSKGKANLKRRYKKGDNWEQSLFYEQEFKGVESIKETHNITNKDIVAFAYDLNPNVALYYTRLKGFRIAPDFTQEHLTNIYTEKMPRILIVNSPDYLGKHHPKDLHIDFKVIAKTPTLVFYELDYSNVIEQKE